MTRISLSAILSAAALWSAVAAAEGPAAEPGSLLALPETAAWQHSRAFVQAFNAGDGESLSRYFAQRLSARGAAQQAGVWRAAALQRLRRELGPIEVVEASGVPTVLVLNANSSSGAGVDIVVLVNADDPRQLDEVLVVRSHEALAAVEAP